jgi:hypothetical protein
VPAAVRRDQLRRDVLVASTRLDLEGAAPRVHCAPHPSLARLLGEVLRPEEVEPQIPCGSIPRYPSQTTTKMVAYEMELGARWCSSTL